ncbi:hypothetical protein IV417_11880 [Alphaproteobacteria bacterium KMM 3653]|uniref:NnrU domain-containing protein n=1 Tax=Harenicola maris TaxID=2841044 RepID=A0AAP2CP98_9RHOB|nr:hypothetical protein [Harenicola maris]
MAILMCGVLLWVVAHGFKRFAPDRRAEMGEKGRGIMAGLILLSVVLMVFGYRWSDAYDLATPPAFLTHINNLLMVVAVFLFSPAPKRGRIIGGMRHPMLVGFKVWAIAHLLVNWDAASFVLFGGLLAWAVVTVIRINKAEPHWQKPAPSGTYAMDAAFLAGSLLIVGIIGYIHILLGLAPFG